MCIPFTLNQIAMDVFKMFNQMLQSVILAMILMVIVIGGYNMIQMMLVMVGLLQWIQCTLSNAKIGASRLLKIQSDSTAANDNVSNVDFKF